MFTNERLIEAYKNGKTEYFDNNSRYIFFSDCHRGDDSVSDEFARNQSLYLHALNYYFSNGYTYVEAGDGDELWEYSDFKYIRLAHSDIFTTLKKFYDDKRLIMLYGNHNDALKYHSYVKRHFHHYYDEYDQKKYELFKGLIAYESLVLKHKTTKQNILVVHGHQGDLMNDQLSFINMILLRYFWRFMHVVGFHNPSSPARNLYKRHKIEITYKKWIRRHRMMLICGHTHRPRFPKRGELPYFNTGCCIHTRGITGIEIIDDTILMVDWRIRSDQNGFLQAERNIMRGPEPISKFDFSSQSFHEDHPTFDLEFDNDKV